MYREKLMLRTTRIPPGIPGDLRHGGVKTPADFFAPECPIRTLRALPKRDQKNRAIFMRRTTDIYRHQGERFLKEFPQGYPNAPTLAALYTLNDLRRVVALAMFSSCPYCGCELNPKNFSADHSTAVKRGGTFHLNNLDIICASCNRIKGVMSDEEYFRFRDFMEAYEHLVQKDVYSRLKMGGMRYVGGVA
jgi:hypothetical protein